MEFDRILQERRSTRKFKPKDIAWEAVADILDAARYAPSSGNMQNWAFIVVKDKDSKKKVSNSSKQSWLADAPVLIVVCSKLDKIKELYGARGEALYSIQNCAAAAENMLLKAADLKIDSCWVSSFDENIIRKEFRLDDDVRPQAVLAFGYGDEFEKEFKRYPLENFVFFESWGNKKRDYTIWPLSKYANNISNKLKK